MLKDNKSKKKPSQKTAAVSSANLYNYKINYLLAVACAAVAILLYSNTIGHDFVLDDSAAITSNLYVQEGLKGIPKLLTIDFWHFSAMKLGYYRPLPLITYAIEYQFFGQNPHVYHFGNVMLYGLTVFVIFLYMSIVFAEKKYWYPLIVTLLFAAHPIHTEVVANIKSRDEILSLLNIMLAIVFQLFYLRKKNVAYLILSLLFCFFALLSKETAMVGILLVPVTLYFRGESISRSVKRSLIFLVPIALFYIQKKLLFETVVPVIPNDLVNYPYNAPELRYSSAFMLFMFFLRILLVPYPLRYDYSYNQLPAVQWDSIWALLGLVLMLGLIVVGVMKLLKRSGIGFAVILFFITLIPAFGFILLRGGIFAERFLYAPTLGLCIAYVIGIEYVTRVPMSSFVPFRKDLFVKMLPVALVALIILSLYSSATVERNKAWSSAFLLYSTDLKTAKNDVHNLLHYGSSWLRKANDEKDSAKRDIYMQKGLGPLKQAIEIHPGFTDAYYWLGYGYEVRATYMKAKENADTAIYFLNEAIKRSVDSYMSYYHLGNIYEWYGRYDISSYYYNKANQYNPEFLPVIAKVNEMQKKHGLNVRVNPLTGKP
jgi:protein O-mannosyl-transferase